MITLDAILAAISAPDPFTQMDGVVREEMAAGRKVKDIFADINPLVNTVLGTPGLTEDGEEAFLGTLDALTGNCHRDCCYFDPPTLPSESEIAGLPWGARVAFAGRCARRVLPLYRVSWPETPLETVAGLVMAVEHAELAATKPIAAAIRAVDAASIANQAALDAGVLVATHSASAAWNAALALNGTDASITRTALAAYEATFAGEIALSGGGPLDPGNELRKLSGQGPTITAIHRDFTRLAQRAQYEHWDDDTPVPPQFFGPLWPEGAPPGWPADPNTPRHTELESEIVASERVIDRIVEDEVVNLFNAINRYHIARGGSPLTLDELLPYLNPSLVPVGS